MEFPQYRKYKNGLSYFKIESKESFIEWKKTGNRWEKFEFKVKILPDRNYINDMLLDYEHHWDALSDLEFEQFLATV